MSEETNDRQMEEPGTEAPNEPSSKTEERKKTRKMLTVYVVIFVGAVLLLLVGSYFAQVRENRQLEQEMGEQTEIAKGVAEKYENLRKENEKLIADNQALRSENEMLHAFVDPVEPYLNGLPEGTDGGEALALAINREAALKALSELQRTYRSGTRSACRELIGKMEEAGLPAYLDEAEKTEYDYICKKAGYKPQQ